MWRSSDGPDPVFASTLHLDISEVQPNLSGPKRPQDRVALPDMPEAIEAFIIADGKDDELNRSFGTEAEFDLHHGDVVVAAITSCTNTSNPAVMVGAGLVARKAVEKGLTRKPWVKSSLAPGSKVVTEYLEKAGLQAYLDELGFNTVGYGCTTCIGNSGPLPEAVHNAVIDNDMVVSSVLSGNRNFEGRIHPLVKANWLASPPLVVAYALAGSTRVNLASDPVGTDREGNDVFLKDIWPSNDEIATEVAKIDESMFTSKYADVFSGDDKWRAVPTITGNTYSFSPDSTYIQLPPFFDEKYTSGKNCNIQGARILALLGDSVTTDHISPAGSIAADSPAANYLIDNGVERKDFNSYGSRRGNHEVMMRGTFGNIRIKNELVSGTEGGYTCMPGDDTPIPIYNAAMQYLAEGTPTVVIGGKEYGTGSSRDWAAKGTLLLGVKAVIVESFERIHRSNLVGMGVLPLEFMPGQDRNTLKLSGSDTFDILGLDGDIVPKQVFEARINRADGSTVEIQLQSRIDTAVEVEYYLSGGVLQFVLNRIKNQ
jgi:aconitate hydratase